jgi:trimethylamine--corrinoid protein Co-methyltransferase
LNLNQIKILTKDEIETIHNATIELLSKVGIKMDCKDVQNLMNEYGAEVDEDSDFVRIPESLVNEMIKKVPKSFTLHGPDGSFNFEVNTTSTQYATIGTPVKIYDPSKKRGVRKTILDDTIKQIRIVDTLKHINCSHVDVWPNDVKYTAIHAHAMYQWVKNTRKPYGLGCFGKLPSQDMMNMASIACGGDEELKKNPRLVGFFSTTSPLQFSKIMTNGFEVFAKYKQPTIIAPEALAGASAPVTLAGLLTEINAENLGGAVLAQIFNPGAPLFYGNVSHIMDMKTGNSAMGSIETGLITTAVAQMGRYYGYPSRSAGGVTDSKVLDLQNGIERMQTLLLAAQAGTNYITVAGTYEATLVEALELLLIDDDLVGMVKRALEGIEVNKETIALDTIEKVATSDKKGASFLGELHTIKHMKKELYMPDLMDRKRRSTWWKKGGKNIIDRAREKVEEVLKTHKPPEISQDIDKEFKDYIKKVESRSLQDYMKAEDLESASAPVPGTEIKED